MMLALSYLLVTAAAGGAHGGAPCPAAAPMASYAPQQDPQRQEPVQESPAARDVPVRTGGRDALRQAAAPQTVLDPQALAIWRSPLFQRRFVESYMSEIEIEPAIDDDERQTMFQVMERVGADDLEGAAELLRSARDGPSTAVFDFTLGNVYFQMDEISHAIAAYQIAVQKFPKFRRAWANLGQIHFRSGDFAKAAEALTRVLELGGGDAVTYGLLGVAHSRQDDDIAAESAFRMAAMFDPKTVDWRLGLAESFFKQGRYAEAVALFEGLIGEDPDNASLWMLQGEALAMMDEMGRAAENFAMAERLGGATAASLSNLGDIYANQDLHDLAADAYLRALALEPESSASRALRAAGFMGANGALDEAVRLLDGIAAAHGDDLPEAMAKQMLKLRARVALASGSSDEEARILEEIVALDPLDGDALILLGQHAARGGDAEQAVFYYERAASIDGFEARALLRHGELLARQRRYAQALPLLRRSLELEPREDVDRFVEDLEQYAKTRR